MSLHRCENIKYYTVYDISTLLSLLETNNTYDTAMILLNKKLIFLFEFLNKYNKRQS